MDDGFETYDPVIARKCVNALVTANQSCSPSALTAAGPAATCAHIIKGTQPEGGDCNTELDCAVPASLCTLTTGTRGHCVAPVAFTHGRLGDPCEITCNGSDCTDIPLLPQQILTGCYREDGLICGSSFTCETPAPPALIGASCRDGKCVEGAFCKSGLCASHLPPGSCNADTAFSCPEGAYCDGTQCQPQLPDGSACHVGASECLHQCDLPPSAPVRDPNAGPIVVEPPYTGLLTGTCAPLNRVTPRSCGAVE